MDHSDLAKRVAAIQAVLDGLTKQEVIALLSTTLEAQIRSLPAAKRGPMVKMVFETMNYLVSEPSQSQIELAAHVIATTANGLDVRDAVAMLSAALTLELQRASEEDFPMLIALVLQSFAKEIPGCVLTMEGGNGTLQ